MLALWKNGSRAVRAGITFCESSAAVSKTSQHYIADQPVSLLQLAAGFRCFGCCGLSPPLQPGLPTSAPQVSGVAESIAARGFRSRSAQLGPPCDTSRHTAGYATDGTKHRSAAVQGVPVLDVTGAANPAITEVRENVSRPGEHVETPFAVKAFYLGKSGCMKVCLNFAQMYLQTCKHFYASNPLCIRYEVQLLRDRVQGLTGISVSFPQRLCLHAHINRNSYWPARLQAAKSMSTGCVVEPRGKVFPLTSTKVLKEMKAR